MPRRPPPPPPPLSPEARAKLMAPPPAPPPLPPRRRPPPLPPTLSPEALAEIADELEAPTRPRRGHVRGSAPLPSPEALAGLTKGHRRGGGGELPSPEALKEISPSAPDQLVNPELFSVLERYKLAERSTKRKAFDRVFATKPGKAIAPTTAATPQQLAAAGQAIGLVSQIADVTGQIARLDVLTAGGNESKAQTAANRARAAVWEHSGVPVDLRPMKAGVLGAELSSNRDAFLDEHVKARAAMQEQVRERSRGLVTEERAKKAFLKGAAGKEHEIVAPRPDVVTPTTHWAGDVIGAGGSAGKALSDQLGALSEGAITGGAGRGGGLVSVITGAMAIDAAIDEISVGGAMGVKGKHDLLAASNVVLQGAGTSATGGLEIARGVVGGDPVLSSLGMAANGLGGALSIVNAAVQFKMATMHGLSGAALSEILSKAREDDRARDISLGGAVEIEAFKAAIASGKSVGSAISAIGGLLAVTPAGPILKIVGSVISGVTSAVETGKDAYQAGKVAEKEIEAMYHGDAEESSEYVLRYGADHRAQNLIRKARGGDSAALDALAIYAIKPADLDKLSDDKLRGIITGHQGAAKKNLGASISEGVAPIKAAIVGDAGPGSDMAERTARAKDLMQYGAAASGKKHNMTKVRAKAFFRTATQIDDERIAQLEILKIKIGRGNHGLDPKTLELVTALLQPQAHYNALKRDAARKVAQVKLFGPGTSISSPGAPPA